MKYGVAFMAWVFLALISVSNANAQVVDKTKDDASKAAKATVEPTKKTTVVVTDALEDAASKTKSATVGTTNTGVTKAKTFGKSTLTVTENVAGQAYEGGKYLTVTSWDGAKWVSKQVWYPNKKSPTKQ